MASTAAAAAKAPAEVAPEAQPKKKNKLALIIILVVVVLLAGAGAGAWYFLNQGDAEEDEQAKADSKPPVFLTIDQFTVNLQPEDGQQFLQVAMTLKVSDPAIADAIKLRMPEVRSRVLLLLSSKKPSQLSLPEGKVKLSEEIAYEVEASLPREKAKDKKKTQADDEEDGKPAKKAKGSKAKKSKPKAGEEQAASAPRVQAVYFTHFIVQ